MSSGKKRVTVGHSISLGVLAKFCHGPIDRITQFFFDDKVAASGSWDGTPNDQPYYPAPSHGQSVIISANGLFGGDNGGVYGRAIIRMGDKDQLVNELFTTSEFTGQDEISADRGVVSVLYTNWGGKPNGYYAAPWAYQFYWGNRPQLPRFGIRAQRIHVQDGGIPQWYDEKAAIGKISGSHISLYFAIDFSTSMNTLTSNGKTRFENAKIAVFDILDSLMSTINSSGGLFSADVMLVGFGEVPDSRTSILRRNVNETSIAQLKSWYPSSGTYAWTYFPAGVTDASSFFAGAPSDTVKKIIFITDGLPTGTGKTAEQIANEGRDIINFIPKVQSHAFNIDLSDTTYTRYMDNMSQGVIPVISGSDSAALRQVIIYSIFGYLDMNPVHAIRERLVSKICGLDMPEAALDDAQLKHCADILHEEGMGVSFLWDRSKPVSELIEDICFHIDALYPQVDRRTGLLYLPLVRDDYDRDNVFELDKSNIVKIEDYKRPAQSDLFNTIVVKYNDLEAKKEMSITRSDPALLKMQGGIRAKDYNMYFFSNYQAANKAAIRLLRAATKRIRTCTAYCDRSAASLRPGDVVRMFYDAPEFEGVIMRVLGVRYGTGRDQQVTLLLSEDIYDFDASAVLTTDEPVDIPNLTGDLVPIAQQRAFELPYYEMAQNLGDVEAYELTNSYPEVGYIGAVAGNPASFIDAKIHVDSGAGYEEIGAVEYSPVAILAADMGLVNPDGSIVELAEVVDIGSIGGARIGSYFMINDECIRFDGIDIDGKVMMGRGCLDTVPAEHPAGSVMFFDDDMLEVIDEQYMSSETVDVKLLPNTGSQILDINDATAMSVTMASRAARPYPPGDFKINNSYFPAGVTGPVSLSWTTRNRAQQTSGTLIGFTDGPIAPEAGTTYSVYIYDNETETLLFSETGITDLSLVVGVVELTGATQIRIELFSVRDGLQSFQPQRHVMAWSSGENLMTFESPYTPDDGDNIFLKFEEM